MCFAAKQPDPPVNPATHSVEDAWMNVDEDTFKPDPKGPGAIQVAGDEGYDNEDAPKPPKDTKPSSSGVPKIRM